MARGIDSMALSAFHEIYQDESYKKPCVTPPSKHSTRASSMDSSTDNSVPEMDLRCLPSLLNICGLLYSLGLAVLHILVSDASPHTYPKYFLLGFILGFVLGPLYIVLNALKRVRHSKKWDKMNVGAAIGIAGIALVPYLVFSTLNPENVKISTVSFTIVYAGCVFILKAIRSDAEQRNHWKFGPSAFLFKNVFPEHHKNKNICRNIFRRCVYGNVRFLTLASLFIVAPLLVALLRRGGV